MEKTIADERLLASAISYLIEGSEFYEASILLLCDLNMQTGGTFYSGDHGITDVSIELAGNRAVYEIINNQDHPATISIKRAFEAVLNTGYYLESLTCRVAFLNFDSDWRSKLLEVIEGKVPLNQCIPIQNKPRYSWNNLLFRSAYEIAIAKALEEYQVLFLPNYMARFTQEGANREADFLICSEGKWGIIEVDGESYHLSAARERV